jgi:nitrile hydratase subunit beta
VPLVDGIRDLGGMDGFGAVEVEPDEPVFHADWERRTWGLSMGTFAAGLMNGGEFRHAIERMDPAQYLSSSYYEHWLTGVATRLVEAGVVDRDDLDARAGGRFPLSGPVTGTAWSAATATGSGFAVGDRVRVRDVTTRGHTRCPRYVRRRIGEVVRVDPASSLPDVEAHSPERISEPVYSVRFTLAELWGGSEVDLVHVDLWQSYLEAA